jgi:hypothetical protein
MFKVEKITDDKGPRYAQPRSGARFPVYSGRHSTHLLDAQHRSGESPWL